VCTDNFEECLHFLAAPDDGAGSQCPPASLTLAVDDSFVASMGSDAAFADCFLTPEELASDPEAAAVAAAFTAAMAAQFGVDSSSITLDGISTAGGTAPGCGGGGGRRLQIGTSLTLSYTCPACAAGMASIAEDGAAAMAPMAAVIAAVNNVAIQSGFSNVVLSTPADVVASIAAPSAAGCE
jgi:hypothetical protein